MKKLLVMYIVLLLAGVARGEYIYPSYGKKNVDIDPLFLGWEGAKEVRYYIWYLDEDYRDVYRATRYESNVNYRGTTDSQEVQVHGLEYDTSYYWRIDVYKTRSSFEQGQIWYFTTEIVPEPATICLLGFGALFLKRRR